ncbi:arsenosugar biosynthesis radical SAM protein ArsS [Rhodopirellula sp.]|nr:arsenosugar biosynthesis radical SAM protein ArsS [Rhodopirellula sp.]MDB4419416.1 arsenosugar biosynthesis radical SAM protein ArsS [bacterium]
MPSILPIIDAGLPTGVVEPFAARVARDAETLTRGALTELQINLGKLCNQTCTHCHVDAGPTKTAENMTPRTANRISELAERCDSLTTVDLTGGAPELNQSFRKLVRHFRDSGLKVIDRCNLTILSEPGHEDLGDFLASNQVQVVASLPCYLEDNVDAQRGSGVFERSIKGLQQLNALGYGQNNSDLELNLVFNPTGPTLPPEQATLERDYKRELKRRYGVQFNHLFAITNIPIKRYAKFLKKCGSLVNYMQMLETAFNPLAARGVMCKTMLSIGWDGQLFDCDFNQMLGMPVAGKLPQTVWNVESFDEYIHKRVAVADHCYGCTAGAGSSCGGAVT